MLKFNKEHSSFAKANILQAYTYSAQTPFEYNCWHVLRIIFLYASNSSHKIFLFIILFRTLSLEVWETCFQQL